jgi:chaperonin cofactor prefoldin
MDKAKAREDLASSNERLEENNHRIRRQEEEFKNLAAHGHETEGAQGRLKDLKQEKESIERHLGLVQEDLQEGFGKSPT